ncbi:N-ethylmaleimide-sensitive factor attachment protein, alpha a [Scleropages formosus]|uniref:N-ethylmaleimide-sensitive factor attachment protein, alpha a n=1 Tax=Scleropages formosus TaxID=113540 RepID=UPI000878114C|nr:alpha-soluble NSF attachment protein [Scleropages formosus]
MATNTFCKELTVCCRNDWTFEPLGSSQAAAFPRRRRGSRSFASIPNVPWPRHTVPRPSAVCIAAYLPHGHGGARLVRARRPRSAFTGETNMDNSGKEKEALALIAEAEKKLKSSQSFFGTLFGGSSKVEEACDMYARAANMFKMAKNWSAAGNAFSQAARLHLQMQSKHDAATNFIDAGNAFKKADPQEAINCLNRAIEIYTDMGRFTIAAKHHISIAEIYETELVDIDKAIAHYEQAADYYKGEESTSSANKCLLKVATYAAQLEQYQKAIEIYEQVGTYAMDNTLLKYSAKDHFFKAALCHFCVDMLNAKLAVQKYEEMFPAFSDSRECKLVKKLLDAYEEQNVDGYTDAVKEFDSISRLDQWLTTMLLRIKKTIQDEESDLR